jgi:hypothetical protein
MTIMLTRKVAVGVFIGNSMFAAMALLVMAVFQ